MILLSRNKGRGWHPQTLSQCCFPSERSFISPRRVELCAHRKARSRCSCEACDLTCCHRPPLLILIEIPLAKVHRRHNLSFLALASRPLVGINAGTWIYRSPFFPANSCQTYLAFAFVRGHGLFYLISVSPEPRDMQLFSKQRVDCLARENLLDYSGYTFGKILIEVGLISWKIFALISDPFYGVKFRYQKVVNKIS